jgi:hypothetical protein
MTENTVQTYIHTYIMYHRADRTNLMLISRAKRPVKCVHKVRFRMYITKRNLQKITNGSISVKYNLDPSSSPDTCRETSVLSLKKIARH